MRVVARVVEAIAVLVPDFATLGLIVPAFFSAYRCAIALGFPGATDINEDLLISLVFGYLIAVAFNLATAVTFPARPNPAPISHPKLRKDELPRQSRSEAVETQFVCEGAEISQPPSFDERYPV